MIKSGSSFWNSTASRLLALLVAIFVGVLGYLQYEKAEEKTASGPDSKISADQLSDIGASKAVAECANNRIMQINQMVSDGFLTEADADKARQQAQSMCVSTANPAPAK